MITKCRGYCLVSIVHNDTHLLPLIILIAIANMVYMCLEVLSIPLSITLPHKVYQDDWHDGELSPLVVVRD